MNAIIEEVLSDYLDERLSPQECAKIERRLAREPDLRAACETLRAARDAVQHLPTVAPSSDWSAEVLLRAAELQSAPDRVDQVRLRQRDASGQPVRRQLWSAVYQRAWPVVVIAGLLLIGLVWMRPQIVGRRLAENVSVPMDPSATARPTRSPETSDSTVVTSGLSEESLETESRPERAVSRDALAAGSARTPAAAVPAADQRRQEVASSAGLGSPEPSILLDRGRLGAESVAIRVRLSRSLFQAVLANHDIAMQRAELELANQVRRDRAEVAEAPLERAGDRDQQEVYVVEATLDQVNAALQELAVQGSIQVLDRLAKNKRQKFAAGPQRNATRHKNASPQAVRSRARTATTQDKELGDSPGKSSAAGRRSAGKEPLSYRILFLLDPPRAEKDESR